MRSPKMMSPERIREIADKAEVKSIEGKLKGGATLESLGLNVRQIKMWEEYQKRKEKPEVYSVDTKNIFGEPVVIPTFSETKESSTGELRNFLEPKPPTTDRAGIYNSGGTNELNFEERNTNSKSPKYMDLEKSTTDFEIVKNLGIECDEDGNMTEAQVEANKGKLWTMDEIIPFLEKQMRLVKGGKIITDKGDLLLIGDRSSNVFIIRGPNNTVRSFRCSLDSGRRRWYVGSREFGRKWVDDGDRVFSRN